MRENKKVKVFTKHVRKPFSKGKIYEKLQKNDDLFDHDICCYSTIFAVLCTWDWKCTCLPRVVLGCCEIEGRITIVICTMLASAHHFVLLIGTGFKVVIAKHCMVTLVWHPDIRTCPSTDTHYVYWWWMCVFSWLWTWSTHMILWKYYFLSVLLSFHPHLQPVSQALSLRWMQSLLMGSGLKCTQATVWQTALGSQYWCICGGSIRWEILDSTVDTLESKGWDCRQSSHPFTIETERWTTISIMRSIVRPFLMRSYYRIPAPERWKIITQTSTTIIDYMDTVEVRARYVVNVPEAGHLCWHYSSTLQCEAMTTAPATIDSLPLTTTTIQPTTIQPSINPIIQSIIHGIADEAARMEWFGRKDVCMCFVSKRLIENYMKFLIFALNFWVVDRFALWELSSDPGWTENSLANCYTVRSYKAP